MSNQEDIMARIERMVSVLDDVIQAVPQGDGTYRLHYVGPVSTFAVGDRVKVIAGPITGASGTVRDPDYMGYVMVNVDHSPNLSGCFLPDELEAA